MALTKAQLIDLNANELIIDLDADTSITADTDDQIDIKIAGADDFTFTANTFTALSGSSIVTPTLSVTSSATISGGAINLAAIDIDGGTDIGAAVADADLFIIDDGAGGTNRKVTASRVKTYMGAEGGAFSVSNLDIDGATDIGAGIADADLFIIDDGAGGTNRKVAASRIKTYIGASTAADDLTIGDAAVTLSTSSGDITIDATANDSDIIFKGTDGGADTTFLTIDGSAAGSATFNHDVILPNNGILQLGDAGENISGDGTNLTITSSADVIVKLGGDQLILHDGTSNISQFDLTSNHLSIDVLSNEKDMFFKGFDGGSQITALTLDMSEAGAATFNSTVTTTGLVIGSTAVTTTAAEINLIDGGTARGTTAVATGDGILINDGGTMRMTNVDTVSTYFAGHNVGGGNIVTTGALDSGSITSGFGAIDNGTSNIRSATITAETAFVPDAANGATLGTTSLEFADLFLHDGAQILFGADQDVVLTHAADVGLTLKTATTSDDTQATLTLQTGDTDIAANDVIGQLHFQAPDEGTGTDAILVAAGIAAISEGNFAADNNATSLVFKTGASEAAAEKVRINSTGYLGIGTTAQVAPLVVSNGGASGMEFHPELTTNTNRFVNYNRSGSAYNKLKVDALEQQFFISGNEQMRLTTNGVLAANAGVALGVGLNNTASNVLDDYEEGTFTPVFAYGTSGSNYQAQNGRYTKIGNQCFFQLQIQGNGLGTTTDQIRISGLPFTALNAAPYGGGVVNISSNFKSDGDITVHKGAGDDDLYFYEYSGSALLGSEATSINAGLLIHGHYITD